MSADQAGAAADDLRLAARHRALQPLARRTATSRSSSPARSSAAATGRWPTSTTRSARCSTGAARPATWAEPEPPRADVFAAKALVEAVLGALRVRLARRPGAAARTCIPAGPARSSAATTVLGVFGELHPQVAARWDFDEPVAVLAIDVGKAVAAAPGPATYADLTTFPELRQDLAVTVSDDDARGAGARRRARGRGRRAARLASRVFDAYRGEQVGAGRVSLALHLEFRAAGPHADRRGRRSGARARSSPRCATSSEVSCVADVLVAGASGFAGALAARLVDRHPQLHARAASPRARTPGRRCSSSTRTTASARVLEELDLDRHSRRRRGDRRLSARRRRARRRRAARARREGRRPQRRLPAASTAASYEQLVRAARRAGADRRRRLRPDRAATASASPAPSSSPTPAAFRPRRCSRSRRSRAPGWSRDVVIDAKTGVSGAGRAPTDVTHFVSVAENVKPYKVGVAPPHAGDRPGARRARRARVGDVRAAPRAGRPGRADVLLRDAARARRRRRASPRCSRRPTRASASSRSSTRRRGCATCARRTAATSASTSIPATGA